MEKSIHYHIHAAIMLKSTIPIYSRLNKVYRNINIESVLCSNYDKVKEYCSKDYSRVRDIYPINWNKNVGIITKLIPKKESDVNDVVRDIKLKILSKGIEKYYNKLIDAHIKECLKNGIICGHEEITKDFKNILNNANLDYSDKNTIIEDLKNTIILKTLEFENEINRLNNTIITSENEYIKKIEFLENIIEKTSKAENEYIKTIESLEKDIININKKYQQDITIKTKENGINTEIKISRKKVFI